MAASVLSLIESLETHLEHTQQELALLRDENARLKEQLSHQPTAQPSHAQNHPPGAGERPDADPLTQAPAPSPVEGLDRQEPQKQETVTQSSAGHEKKAPVEGGPAASGVANTVENGTPPSPHALLKQWYERYPDAFFKGHTKPLKIGIHHDLAQREPWSGKLIRRALANYVNLPRYVKSMREGAERVDLDGLPAGKVDKEASLHANERRKEQVKEAPSRPASNNADNAVKNTPRKTPKSESRAPEAPRRPDYDSATSKRSDEKKPLSMEEKIKGLMQKFEGR
ncbi:ProQ/FINO family protein [Vreelandella sp. EE22]